MLLAVVELLGLKQICVCVCVRTRVTCMQIIRRIVRAENKAMSRPRRLRLSGIWIVSLNGIVEQQCDRCEVLEL